MTTATVTVRIAPNNFNTGLKYAKTFGGRFNPSDKTWTLPLTEQVARSLKAAGAYGLIVVSQRHEEHDAGCPAYYGGAGCECK